MSKNRLIKNNLKMKNERREKVKRAGAGRWMNIFYILFFCLIFGSGICYLGILNSKAESSFRVADLENELADLRETNKNLEVVASELQQVARIQEAAGALGLVATERAEYLSVGSQGLAQR